MKNQTLFWWLIIPFFVLAVLAYYVEKDHNQIYDRGYRDGYVADSTVKANCLSVSIGMMNHDSTEVDIARLVIPNKPVWHRANIRLSAEMEDTSYFVSMWITKPDTAIQIDYLILTDDETH
jgi:hypothetical protein